MGRVQGPFPLRPRQAAAGRWSIIAASSPLGGGQRALRQLVARGPAPLTAAGVTAGRAAGVAGAPEKELGRSGQVPPSPGALTPGGGDEDAEGEMQAELDDSGDELGGGHREEVPEKPQAQARQSVDS